MICIGDFDNLIDVPEEGISSCSEIISVMDDNVNLLISEGAIRSRTEYLVKQICDDFPLDICAVVLLKGGIVFFSDLIRAINKQSGKHVFIDSIQVSSYEKEKSTGTINISKDIDNIEGRDVLLVEDVLDTGLTLSYVKKHLLINKKARSVKITCIVQKACQRKVDVKVDYIGFSVPDKFIVGYGIDYDQKYRALPFIGYLKEFK
jgi:hypoxanthine phosphoribosyltransferase